MSIISRNPLPDGWCQTVLIDANGRIEQVMAPAADIRAAEEKALATFVVAPDDPWSPEIMRVGGKWQVHAPLPVADGDGPPLPWALEYLPDARFSLLTTCDTREDALDAARCWLAELGRSG